MPTDPVQVAQTSYLTPRGECSNCGGKHAPDDSFTYRGLHFCTECVMALASWFLDGGQTVEPEQFGWVLDD